MEANSILLGIIHAWELKSTSYPYRGRYVLFPVGHQWGNGRKPHEIGVGLCIKRFRWENLKLILGVFIRSTSPIVEYATGLYKLILYIYIYIAIILNPPLQTGCQPNVVITHLASRVVS